MSERPDDPENIILHELKLAILANTTRWRRAMVETKSGKPRIDRDPVPKEEDVQAIWLRGVLDEACDLFPPHPPG